MRALTKAVGTRTAVKRAARVWQETARAARAALRAREVRGSLRALDEVASGRRGLAIPKGLALYTMAQYAAGLTPLQITEQLQEAVARIVPEVCESAHGGPHAA